MTKKMLVLAGLLAIASMGGKAHATYVSTVPVYAASQFIAAPSNSNQATYLKSLFIINDSTNNVCAYLYNSANIDTSKSNLKVMLCALANTTAFFPPGGHGSPNPMSSAVDTFLGELLNLGSGITSINTGVVDSTKLAPFVGATYQYSALR